MLFVTDYAENAVLGSGQLGPDMAALTRPFAIEAMVTRIRTMMER